MKNSVLFCLLSFSFFGTVIAQDAGKWYMGLSISPDLCYRQLVNSSGDPIIDGVISARNGNEEFKLGFTAGLNVKRRINSTFSLETGLLYSNKGYMLHLTGLVFGDQIDPGQTPAQSVNDYRVRYNYKYLDIPFKVNAALSSEEKYAFYFTAGAVLNVFLQQKNVSVFKSPDGSRRVTTSEGDPLYANNSLDISPFAGFGLRYRLGKHLHFQMEPLFRYGMLPSFNTPIKQHLWNCGLNTVLYYAL